MISHFYFYYSEPSLRLEDKWANSLIYKNCCMIYTIFTFQEQLRGEKWILMKKLTKISNMFNSV